MWPCPASNCKCRGILSSQPSRLRSSFLAPRYARWPVTANLSRWTFPKSSHTRKQTPSITYRTKCTKHEIQSFCGPWNPWCCWGFHGFPYSSDLRPDPKPSTPSMYFPNMMQPSWVLRHWRKGLGCLTQAVPFTVKAERNIWNRALQSKQSSEGHVWIL